MLLFLTRPSVLKTNFFWNWFLIQPNIYLAEKSFFSKIYIWVDNFLDEFFFAFLKKDYNDFLNLVFFYEGISKNLKINKQNLKDELLLISKILEKNNSDLFDLLKLDITLFDKEMLLKTIRIVIKKTKK